MTSYLEITGAIIILAGSVFLLLASVGLIRMPDFYSRIQAGTKASTLGTMLIYVGLGFLMPGWIGKVIVLILFVLITNPVSSHVLARAAHYVKTPLAAISVLDKLAESEEAPENKTDVEPPDTKNDD